MCKFFKYLAKTTNGSLIFCSKSKTYQLCYKNLNFDLTEIELESLAKYLKNIDCDYWEKEYQNSIYEKKIPIPTLQSNFIILLDRMEVYELLNLLDINKKTGFISFLDINYPIYLN